MMITQYLDRLLSQAVYTTDESWYVVAEVPWYQWFFSQWRHVEEARTNLKDAVEWVITLKMAAGDTHVSQDIQAFISTKNYAQAESIVA